MKRIYGYIITLALIAFAAGCKPEKKPADSKIAGSWELMDIQYTKAAQIDGQTMEVLLTFDAAGTFTMSQKLGEGRFRDYSGNWILDSDVLSGTYSDGKAWGASYRIFIEDDTLSMTPVGKEVPETYIYSRRK